MFRRSHVCCGEFYDVVVIGGGSSGVLAATRFANTNLKTLMIEEGPNPLDKKTPVWHHVQPAAKHIHKLEGRYLAKKQKTSPQDTSRFRELFNTEEKTRFNIPTPQVVGGGSVMGPSSWIRATKADVEEGGLNTVVDLDDLGSYYKKLENVDEGENKSGAGWRGLHGKLFQTRPMNTVPYYKLFTEALIRKNLTGSLPAFNVPNDPTLQEGVGRSESLVNPFTHRSASVLPCVLESCISTKRPLTVMANTRAAYLVGDGSDTVKAVAVENPSKPGEYTEIEASSFVVCAGAIGSAKVLTHPKSKQTLPAEISALPIGENFWTRPSAVLDYPTRDKSSIQPFLHSSLVRKLEELYLWRHLRSVMSNTFDDLLHHHRLPQASKKNLNDGPQYGTAAEEAKQEKVWVRTTMNPFRLQRNGDFLFSPNEHGFQLNVEVMTPKSRGTVKWERLGEGEGEGEEGSGHQFVIDPNYFSDPLDKKALSQGLRYMDSACRESPVLANNYLVPQEVEELEAAAAASEQSEDSVPSNANFMPSGICGGTVSMETCLNKDTFNILGLGNVFAAGTAIIPSPPEGDVTPLSMALTELANDRALRL